MMTKETNFSVPLVKMIAVLKFNQQEGGDRLSSQKKAITIAYVL